MKFLSALAAAALAVLAFASCDEKADDVPELKYGQIMFNGHVYNVSENNVYTFVNLQQAPPRGTTINVDSPGKGTSVGYTILINNNVADVVIDLADPVAATHYMDMEVRYWDDDVVRNYSMVISEGVISTNMNGQRSSSSPFKSGTLKVVTEGKICKVDLEAELKDGFKVAMKVKSEIPFI